MGYLTFGELLPTDASEKGFLCSILRLLDFGTVIYQFFPTGKCLIITAVAWCFPLLGVLTTIYVKLSIYGTDIAPSIPASH